ncbi:hypothetical protein PMAYCL1PPCAC_22802, partial [Pristionchus mayeri]
DRREERSYGHCGCGGDFADHGGRFKHVGASAVNWHGIAVEVARSTLQDGFDKRISLKCECYSDPYIHRRDGNSSSMAGHVAMNGNSRFDIGDQKMSVEDPDAKCTCLNKSSFIFADSPSLI